MSTSPITLSKEGDCSSVLYVDPFCTDNGHLLNDDLFLVECIAPLTDEFLAATSSFSAASLRQKLGVQTFSPPLLKVATKSRLQRMRIFQFVLSLPCLRFKHIIFQSFEEVSALLLMLLHPSKRVHLIVTNNLRPDRLERHPFIGRLFLRNIFNRAASIVVHSQWEVNKVREIAPKIDARKVFTKPFHQFSATWHRIPWEKKSRTILFLGPELAHKQVTPVIDLIKADKDCQFRYVFCSMNTEMAPKLREFLESRQNVQIHYGYLTNNEYGRIFNDAMLIILTHDTNFEGALSGVFCDAVASGTAIIARDMAPHSEFFERFGSMGFLVDYQNPEWCEKVLNADLAARYLEFLPNMAACRESCNMESIRHVFHNILTCPE